MAPLINLPLHLNLLQKLHWHLLPKIQVNRHFLSIIASLTPIISGLGLPSIEVELTIEMIGLVITLLPILVATSFYLKESLELLQLESGLNSTILEADFDKLSFLTTPCWIYHLWSLTNSANLSICLLSIHYPSLQYPNDKTIISRVLELNIFSKEELYHLNILWIYLQVIFILDLLQYKSNYIKQYYRVGARDTSQSFKYKWPVVIPSRKSNTIWQRLIISISSQYYILSCINWRTYLYTNLVPATHD